MELSAGIPSTLRSPSTAKALRWPHLPFVSNAGGGAGPCSAPPLPLVTTTGGPAGPALPAPSSYLVPPGPSLLLATAERSSRACSPAMPGPSLLLATAGRSGRACSPATSGPSLLLATAGRSSWACSPATPGPSLVLMHSPPRNFPHPLPAARDAMKEQEQLLLATSFLIRITKMTLCAVLPLGTLPMLLLARPGPS
ncbi:uncharacterized protein LOC119323547 [Triticum dicoccoides]|uniref:uncharacterized protein LOC119323547 n=1 Tax=Triticum dicoccoides TaxID=85692 RepID=UPI00188F89D2|nr:uncharacterized protein LOC119323547 [Triticum dicoccoides]XP_037453139.1 uncharacterized protein LOC119323547 [Triticum dicoccoides]